MESDALYEIAMGPGGASAVLLLVLVTVYRLAVTHLIPLAKLYVESTEDRWVKQMQEHTTDRDAYKTSLRELNSRQDRSLEILGDIHTKVEKIHDQTRGVPPNAPID